MQPPPLELLVDSASTGASTTGFRATVQPPPFELFVDSESTGASSGRGASADEARIERMVVKVSIARADESMVGGSARGCREGGSAESCSLLHGLGSRESLYTLRLEYNVVSYQWREETC